MSVVLPCPVTGALWTGIHHSLASDAVRLAAQAVAPLGVQFMTFDLTLRPPRSRSCRVQCGKSKQQPSRPHCPAPASLTRPGSSWSRVNR